MRAAFLRFFGIALLGLHQPAHARRDSGDSSGGSSSDGSSSDGSSPGFDFRPLDEDRSSDCYNVITGPIGNASDPFDPMYMNQWLHKFVGSYYNGSVVSIPTFFISSLGEYWVLTMGYHHY